MMLAVYDKIIKEVKSIQNSCVKIVNLEQEITNKNIKKYSDRKARLIFQHAVEIWININIKLADELFGTKNDKALKRSKGTKNDYRRRRV